VMSPILIGSSPSWRTDLPSQIRSSHGRGGIGMCAVYQEKQRKVSSQTKNGLQFGFIALTNQ
jgi:hypothetical protein